MKKIPKQMMMVFACKGTIIVKVNRKCKTCGKIFQVYQSSLDKSNTSGNFCCRKCYNAYLKTLTGEKNKSFKRVKVHCTNRGKEILIIPSKLNVYKNSFCCRKCKYKYHHYYIEGNKNCNWKGGSSKYRGPDFGQIKKDNFQHCCCALCGKKTMLNIHHIIPYRLTQDNSLENLIPLCRKHHKIVESYFTKYLENFGDFETSKFVLGNIYQTYYLAHLAGGKNK